MPTSNERPRSQFASLNSRPFRLFAIVTVVLLLIANAIAALYYSRTFRTTVGSFTLHETLQQSADENARQYRALRPPATMADHCVKAIAVTEAYEKAHDAPSYENWAAIRDANCKAAGMPQ